MKIAVKQYKQEWEEQQIAQLVQFHEKLIPILNNTLNFTKLILDLSRFLTYQLLRFAWSTFRAAAAPQVYHQLVRKEPWIFRHIK